MACTYQEVIVDTPMLKVMGYGRPVGTIDFQPVHGLALSDASVRQQHVGHLQHRCHMHAASKEMLKCSLKAHEVCPPCLIGH